MKFYWLQIFFTIFFYNEKINLNYFLFKKFNNNSFIIIINSINIELLNMKLFHLIIDNFSKN